VEAFLHGVKRPKRKADPSHHFSSKLMNTWSSTSTYPYVLLPWSSIKHKDNYRLLSFIYFWFI
jgi:hypothetical protein